MAAGRTFRLLIALILISSFCLGSTAFAQYDLTVNVVPSQGGTVKADCATACQYSAGAWAHLIAIPRSGYVFHTWGGDCSGSGTNPSAVLMMDASKSCDVTFLPCVGGKIRNQIFKIDIADRAVA